MIWEWEGNGNEIQQSWEWELLDGNGGTGIKNPFPNTSSVVVVHSLRPSEIKMD